MKSTDFESIDKILVINLEHRTDRREKIQRELDFLPKEKIVFVKAIYNSDNPRLGCAQSHIKALELAQANKWRNVLILEDDMTWNRNKYSEGTKRLRQLISSVDWNVILLGALSPIFYENSLQVRNAQGAHAYLIKSEYYSVLSSYWKQNLSEIHPHKTAIDEIWHYLMVSDKKWYVVVPLLCLQSEGYSDIDKKTFTLNKGDSTFIDSQKDKSKSKIWVYILYTLLILLVLSVLGII